ncbi:uncharacterized protein [Solanum lycopersicum]|uniref:uncharacterized protein n=1 Tax=Solanum lycopersicum TaxID=4081 RepID=UPI003748E4A1
MAGGGNFLHRVISYVENKLIVNGLANNQTFQRFAVRTSKRIYDLSKMAVQTKRKIADQIEDVSKNFEVLTVELLKSYKNNSVMWLCCTWQCRSDLSSDATMLHRIVFPFLSLL